MQRIVLETTIAASIERCFLLSLSIDLHKASTAHTNEQAIGGVTSGLIGPNQTVTWRARHFGLMLTQTALISQYTRLVHFQDTMARGAFQSFVHDHYFEDSGFCKTLMRDELCFSAPLGPLGWFAEVVVLHRYLHSFLETKNQLIKRVAESQDEWKRFLP